jgi:hypothetical protein
VGAGCLDGVAVWLGSSEGEARRVCVGFWVCTKDAVGEVVSGGDDGGYVWTVIVLSVDVGLDVGVVGGLVGDWLGDGVEVNSSVDEGVYIKLKVFHQPGTACAAKGSPPTT